MNENIVHNKTIDNSEKIKKFNKIIKIVNIIAELIFFYLFISFAWAPELHEDISSFNPKLAQKILATGGLYVAFFVILPKVKEKMNPQFKINKSNKRKFCGYSIIISGVLSFFGYIFHDDNAYLSEICIGIAVLLIGSVLLIMALLIFNNKNENKVEKETPVSPIKQKILSFIAYMILLIILISFISYLIAIYS